MTFEGFPVHADPAADCLGECRIRASSNPDPFRSSRIPKPPLTPQALGSVSTSVFDIGMLHCLDAVDQVMKNATHARSDVGTNARVRQRDIEGEGGVEYADEMHR